MDAWKRARSPKSRSAAHPRRDVARVPLDRTTSISPLVGSACGPTARQCCWRSRAWAARARRPARAARRSHPARLRTPSLPRRRRACLRGAGALFPTSPALHLNRNWTKPSARLCDSAFDLHRRYAGDATGHKECSGASRSDPTGGEENRRPSQQTGAGESQSESRVRGSGIRKQQIGRRQRRPFQLYLWGVTRRAGRDRGVGSAKQVTVRQRKRSARELATPNRRVDKAKGKTQSAISGLKARVRDAV